MREYYTPKKLEKPIKKPAKSHPVKKEGKPKFSPPKKIEMRPDKKIETIHELLIEVIAVYPDPPPFPSKKIVQKGTFHITIPSYGIDIRGLSYILTPQGKILIFLPFKKIKTDEGIINYPFISFTNKQLQKAFLNAIHYYGSIAIKKKFDELEIPYDKKRS